MSVPVAVNVFLYVRGTKGDPEVLRSVARLAPFFLAGPTLVLVGSFFHGGARDGLWIAANVVNLAGALDAGGRTWRVSASHFAERHALFVIIALGESIVAIGVGAAGHLDLGIGTAAVLGVGLAAALWWSYFDIVALVSARRLAAAAPGREQNELARDSYSYMHLALVAGIVLAAFGIKVTIAHTADHLHAVPAFALLGGVAVYLLGLVGFRYRHVHTVSRRRLGLAIVLALLIPVATAIPALVSLAVVDLLLVAVIALDTRSYGDGRSRLRQEMSVARAETP